jgi:hypothetical protein
MRLGHSAKDIFKNMCEHFQKLYVSMITEYAKFEGALYEDTRPLIRPICFMYLKFLPYLCPCSRLRCIDWLII